MTPRSSRSVRLAALRESLRTQLWPTPVAGILLALVAGIALPLLDERWDEHLPPAVANLVFGGGAGAARTVLDAMASSLITVTSLTFSLTVVTLQLAASQFSPRLLRTFAQDRFVHVTLAMFLATFTYALTVLRTVRSADETASGVAVAEVVPQISITVAFLLTIASVVCLVLFLAHLAQEIRVERVLATVQADALATAENLYPHDGTVGVPARSAPEPPPTAAAVLAPASGFLCGVDEAALLAIATEVDVVVSIDRLPGASVVQGTPLGRIWNRPEQADDGPNDHRPTSAAARAVADVLAAAVAVGHEPTQAQDLAFGLRQMTDVANKALSPGINDPTTAVHALGHAAAFLCAIAPRDLGDQVAHDAHGRLRVVVRRPDFAALLDLALTQPRRYAAADPVVLGRIAQLLHEVAFSSDRSAVHGAVRGQLHRLRETIAAQDFDTVERGHLHEQLRDVDQLLEGGAS